MAPQQWPYRARDLEGAWAAIEDIRYRVDQLATADEIATAVTERVKAKTVLGLTTIQKTLAALATGIVVASAVLQIVHPHG